MSDWRSEPSRTVRRRRVFFLHAFDGRSAKAFHAWLASEAARYSAREPGAVEVSDPRQGPSGGASWATGASGMNDAPRTGSGNWADSASWVVRSGQGSTAVETTFTYLAWNDFVRDRLRAPLLWKLKDAATTFGSLLGSGLLRRLLRVSPAYFMIVLYPYIAILAFTALGVGAGWAAAIAAPNAPLAIQITGGVAVALVVLWATSFVDRTTFVYLLSAVNSLSLSEARDGNPDLSNRLDAFAGALASAFRHSDADEVIIAGHSIGAPFAISVVARALETLRQEGVDEGVDADRRLTLLTVGGITPLFSFQPQAARFRRELGAVADSPRVDWLDVTCPRDPVSVCFFDAAREPDVPRAAPTRGPRIVSARFSDIFEPWTLVRLRFSIFETHFAFFRARERPGAWDWFGIVSGPQPLSDRYPPRRPNV